ncbi:hypothetical protein [Paenibacillus sp. FSL F4-0243]|uniref:hypothetical protein n=1 Tax=unclassified Paenibacillus TaxID=185978 RepID=UPI0030D7B3F6
MENKFIEKQLQHHKAYLEKMAASLLELWTLSEPVKIWILSQLEDAYYYIPDDIGKRKPIEWAFSLMLF